MGSNWRVVVADGHEITRRAFAAVLQARPETEAVLECTTSADALALIEQSAPHLLLVDARSPGLELVAAAKELAPGLKVVVMAGYDHADEALQAVLAGAEGYLVKGMHPSELVACLQCIVDTGVMVASPLLLSSMRGLALGSALQRDAGRPEQTAPGVWMAAPQLVQPAAVPMLGAEVEIAGEEPELLGSDALALLTPREREIFSLIARNRSNKEIAHTLSIAEQTVKSHVSRILTKLGQPNRAQAVIHGLRNGFLTRSGPVPAGIRN